MARGWRLGRLLTTAPALTQATFASTALSACPLRTPSAHLRLFGLGILVSRLGLFGLRKLRE